MNDRRLARQYGALAPDERFRLAIRATARDDHKEFERLVESCPERVYRQSDAAFVERAEAARLMSLLVIGEIRPAFARLAVLKVSVDMVRRALILGAEAALESLEALPSDGELAEIYEAVEGEDWLPRAFEEVLGEVLADAAAIWQAFGSVCLEQIGLDPKTVIAGALGPLFIADRSAELDGLAVVDADEERVAAWRELFARRWHRAAT